MTARSDKAELDRVLGFAEEAGYAVTAKGGQYLVVAPGGESTTVVASPSGRNLRNQLARLKRIGVPVSKEELRQRKARQATKLVAAAVSDPVATPAAPAAPHQNPPSTLQVRFEPEPAQHPAPPTPAPPAPASPAPSPAPAPTQQEDTDPVSDTITPAVPDLAAMTAQAAYESGEVSLLGYVLWRTIRMKSGVQPMMLLADRGVVWEGPLKRELNELFPDLSLETKQAVHKYVTDTENLHCVRRPKAGREPLWWARDEWQHTSRSAPHFTPVRTSRHPAPRLSAGEPGPVTTRRIGDPVPAPAQASSPAPVPAPPTPARVAAPPADPRPAPAAPTADGGPVEMTPQLVLAGVQALIDANAELAAANDGLRMQVRLLRAQNAALTRQLPDA